MASLAVLRSATIKTNDPAIDFLLLRVTLRTTHHAMRAVERKISPIVIERPRAPLRNGVATRAVLFPSRQHELAAVDILMTLETLLRGMREIGRKFKAHRVPRRHRDRLMTSDAGGALMCAFKDEFRRGMVKAMKLFPIPCIVAGLAGLFGGMWIRVATRAGLISKVILTGERRRGSRDMGRVRIIHVSQGLVAIDA